MPELLDTFYLPAGTDQEWRRESLCRGIGNEVFFAGDVESRREAKRMCGLCPVREECLEEALLWSHADDHGVRGGLSRSERRELRKGRERVQQPINHGTEGGYRTHLRRGEDACQRCQDAANGARRIRSSQSA